MIFAGGIAEEISLLAKDIVFAVCLLIILAYTCTTIAFIIKDVKNFE